jgi:alpha-tubulin suppressor-like RCC1 family protein
MRNRLKKAATALIQGDNWKALENMDAAKECILNMRNYRSLFVPLEYRLALLLLRLLTSKETNTLQNAIEKLMKWLIYFHRPANTAGCLSNSSSHPLYGLLLKCSKPTSNGLDTNLSRNLRDQLVRLFEDVNDPRTRKKSLLSGSTSTSSSTALLNVKSMSERIPFSNLKVQQGDTIHADVMTNNESHVDDFVVDFNEENEKTKNVALQKVNATNLDGERSEMIKALESLCDTPWSEFSYQLPAALFEEEDDVDGGNRDVKQQSFLNGSSALVAQGSVVALGKPFGLSLDEEAKLKSSSHGTNALISDVATNGSCGGVFPRLISFPLPMRSIQQVACGYRHTAFVTSGDRQLYTYGYGECGPLGHGDEVSLVEPTQVLFFSTNESLRVQHVSCGREHTMVVTLNGDLYGFGWAEAGRIGNGEIGSVFVPTKVETLKEKIKSLSCGREHTLALSQRGGIYAFGAGFGGRIGNGEEDDVELPVVINPLDPSHETEVVAVDAGECHSCALTSKGQVFTWGFGSYGALGSGDRSNRLRPELISLPVVTHQQEIGASSNDSIAFSSIACGSYHTLACATVGRVFGWGDTAAGQLGLAYYQSSGNDLVILSPVELELEANNVTQIACGNFTSGACTNDGKVIMCCICS